MADTKAETVEAVTGDESDPCAAALAQEIRAISWIVLDAYIDNLERRRTALMQTVGRLSERVDWSEDDYCQDVKETFQRGLRVMNEIALYEKKRAALGHHEEPVNLARVALLLPNDQPPSAAFRKLAAIKATETDRRKWVEFLPWMRDMCDPELL